MSKDLQNQINKKVKYISLGSNFTNSYWPAKISTMNSMKITTFKTNNSETNDEIQQTNNSESNDEIIKPIFQVTNDPDIDEYTTDIW